MGRWKTLVGSESLTLVPVVEVPTACATFWYPHGALGSVTGARVWVHVYVHDLPGWRRPDLVLLHSGDTGSVTVTLRSATVPLFVTVILKLAVHVPVVSYC